MSVSLLRCRTGKNWRSRSRITWHKSRLLKVIIQSLLPFAQASPRASPLPSPPLPSPHLTSPHPPFPSLNHRRSYCARPGPPFGLPRQINERMQTRRDWGTHCSAAAAAAGIFVANNRQVLGSSAFDEKFNNRKLATDFSSTQLPPSGGVHFHRTVSSTQWTEPARQRDGALETADVPVQSVYTCRYLDVFC